MNDELLFGVWLLCEINEEIVVHVVTSEAVVFITYYLVVALNKSLMQNHFKSHTSSRVKP